MNEYLTILENFGSNMEVPIIRATKINKVLKAILKLEAIPREDEFKFKNRSQTLLDQWNKLMANEGTPAAAPNTATNGVNGTSESHAEDKKSEEPKGKAEKESTPNDATKETPEVPEKAEKDEKEPSTEVRRQDVI